METLDLFLEYFDIGEKDIIMFIFFAGVFLSIFIWHMIEVVCQWYKQNRTNIMIDGGYLLKIVILPFFILRLRIKGVPKKFCRKAINDFLYA